MNLLVIYKIVNLDNIIDSLMSYPGLIKNFLNININSVNLVNLINLDNPFPKYLLPKSLILFSSNFSFIYI